jgi:hypothetical protein
MRIEFYATLDDFVDVALRSLKRSKEICSWWSNDRIASALLIGTACYFVIPGSLTAKIASVLIGYCGYFLAHPYIQQARVKRRLSRLYEERFGANFPVKIEVELSEKGVWTKQLEAEVLQSWKTVSDIEEVQDSVDIVMHGSEILAVRKRAFQSEEEKRQFIELANRFLQSSRLMSNTASNILC